MGMLYDLVSLNSSLILMDENPGFRATSSGHEHQTGRCI